MANETYISFLKENDNSYQKPDKEVKRLEKSDFIGKTVDDSYIAGLYDKLEEEILQRGGYQSIVQFSPDEENHFPRYFLPRTANSLISKNEPPAAKKKKGRRRR